MKNPFAFVVGGVVSADIAVPDPAQMQSFYAKVLTTGKQPLWREDLLNSQGTPIIGIGAKTPDYGGLPLQWMPHFQVADVKATVMRVMELGGTELLHGKSEQGESLWAGVADPNGAAFGVIPVVTGQAADMSKPQGTGLIEWLTLVTHDVADTCHFYEQVLGCKAMATDKAGEFEIHHAGGEATAAITEDSGNYSRVPPVWVLSLTVGDLAESLLRVTEFDGKVLHTDADQASAIIQDPIGVTCAIQSSH